MRVYLAGPRSDGPDPYKWHNGIAECYPEIEWINPFTAQPPNPAPREIFKRDIELVRSSDAVLLRRKADYNLCGASMEAYDAYQHDVPVVVWNEAGDDLPLFLDMVSVRSKQTPAAAVEMVKEVVR